MCQGTHFVNSYTEDFYRLSAQKNLRESDSKLVAYYIRGLNILIRDKLELSSIWSLSRVGNFTQNIELQVLQNLRTLVQKRPT